MSAAFSFRAEPVVIGDLSQENQRFLLRLAYAMETKPRRVHLGYLATLMGVSSHSTAKSRMETLVKQGFLAKIGKSDKSGVRLAVTEAAIASIQSHADFVTKALAHLRKARGEVVVPAPTQSVIMPLGPVTLSHADEEFLSRVAAVNQEAASTLRRTFSGELPLSLLPEHLSQHGEGMSFLVDFATKVMGKRKPLSASALPIATETMEKTTATLQPEVSQAKAQESAARHNFELPVLASPDILHGDVAQRIIYEMAVFAPAILSSKSFASDLKFYLYTVLAGTLADYGSMTRRLRTLCKLLRDGRFSPAYIVNDELFQEVTRSSELLASK